VAHKLPAHILRVPRRSGPPAALGNFVAPSLDVLAQVAVETLRISLPTIVEAARGTLTSEVCDERLDSWSRNLVRQAGISIETTGRENLVPGEAFVVMSNHQSHYDIPTLFQALRIPLRMVAKKEIFRIPFMAGAMRAAGFVEVDRNNRRSAMENLSTARTRLKDAVSIWIAPEGTRSKTGQLGPFKKGGFHLALRGGMRILPVSIEGTRFVLPAGGLTVVRGATASVTIGKPIDPADYGKERIGELIAAVRDAILRPLPEGARGQG
jgi:1-acyl-sn-glycerol-3-phosphate acyltransferase